MQEILRIVDALQTADKNSCALPANWHPGEAVIIPAPATQAEAEKRTKEGYECVDRLVLMQEETLSFFFFF